MRIVAYGCDVGPSNNLALLRDASPNDISFNLIDRGPLSEAPGVYLESADVVITGLSSFNNKGELDLAKTAICRGIPWVILSDTHGSESRPAAKELAPFAHLLLASEADRARARALGYRMIHYLGGPPAWQKFWGLRHESLDPRLTIYVGGFKSKPLTEELLCVVSDGVRQYRQAACMIFRPHPAEDGQPDNRASAYADIMRGIPVIDASSADQALCAADVSFFSSAGTEVIKAAKNRFVVGYYESARIRERVLAASGQETFWPVEMGAAVKVSSASDIAGVLHASRNASWRKALAARQERAYPRPAPGSRVEANIFNLCRKLTR
jgi:hypothetical protein